MEKLITVKNELNSLEALQTFLNQASSYTCSKEYDTWEHRIDSNGQLAQCLVLKKSSMHAVKLFYIDSNTIKVSYIIPNKMMNAYFGKSQKARQNIVEIIIEKIKAKFLENAQNNAFKELEEVVLKAA